MLNQLNQIFLPTEPVLATLNDQAFGPVVRASKEFPVVVIHECEKRFLMLRSALRLIDESPRGIHIVQTYFPKAASETIGRLLLFKSDESDNFRELKFTQARLRVSTSTEDSQYFLEAKGKLPGAPPGERVELSLQLDQEQAKLFAPQALDGLIEKKRLSYTRHDSSINLAIDDIIRCGPNNSALPAPLSDILFLDLEAPKSVFQQTMHQRRELFPMLSEALALDDFPEWVRDAVKVTRLGRRGCDEATIRALSLIHQML